MPKINFEKYRNHTFERFRELASDTSLTKYEKIGFPDDYREGFEEKIFIDIRSKLSNLQLKDKLVIDIGSGCSELERILVEHCRRQGHKLILIDSQEMLNHLPDEPFIIKMPGCFPVQFEKFLGEYSNQIDIILIYDVFQYVYAESNPFYFLDRAAELLTNQGQMLIGDIPNISQRKRFFSSERGIKFHQNFMETNDIPKTRFNTLETGKIDDAVLFSIVQRYRNAGFDAYVLPQPEDLPMANRREDILIKRL